MARPCGAQGSPSWRGPRRRDGPGAAPRQGGLGKGAAAAAAARAILQNKVEAAKTAAPPSLPHGVAVVPSDLLRQLRGGEAQAQAAVNDDRGVAPTVPAAAPGAGPEGSKAHGAPGHEPMEAILQKQRQQPQKAQRSSSKPQRAPQSRQAQQQAQQQRQEKAQLQPQKPQRPQEQGTAAKGGQPASAAGAGRLRSRSAVSSQPAVTEKAAVVDSTDPQKAAAPQRQAPGVVHRASARSAGVGADEEAASVMAPLVEALIGTLPPPDGAQHAAVGTDDGAGGAAPAEAQLSPHSGSPPAAPAQPRPPPLSGEVVQATPSKRSPLADFLNGAQTPQAVPVSPALESPHGYGRCDLFGNAREMADRERERRRIQAQMLAEQIEEQRKRKEQEKRKREEEERAERRRLEKELQEIEKEQKAREAREREKKAAVAAALSPKAPSQMSPANGGDNSSVWDNKDAQGHARRRRPAPDLGNDSPQATAGAWGSSPNGAVPSETSQLSPQRRRRRRRERDSSSATWRTSDRGRRTWDEDLSLRNPDTRHSPLPWMSSNDGDVLSTVRESDGEMIGTAEVRRHRRTRRTSSKARERSERERERDRDPESERGRDRDRSLSKDPPERRQSNVNGADPWMSPTRGEWRNEEAEPKASGRPPHPSTRKRASSDLSAAEPPPQPAERPNNKFSEDDLREQLGSVVRVCEPILRVCEQLLRERAEEKRERAEEKRDVERKLPLENMPVASGVESSAQSQRSARKSTQPTPRRRKASRELKLSPRSEGKTPRDMATPQLPFARDFVPAIQISPRRDANGALTFQPAGFGGGGALSSRSHASPISSGRQPVAKGHQAHQLDAHHAPSASRSRHVPIEEGSGAGAGGYGGGASHEERRPLAEGQPDDPWSPDALAGILSDAANIGALAAPARPSQQAPVPAIAEPQPSNLLGSWPSSGLGDIAGGGDVGLGFGARRSRAGSFEPRPLNLPLMPREDKGLGRDPTAGAPGDLPPSPFKAQARGMSLRRGAVDHRPQLLISPLLTGGGGVNAHWPSVGGRGAPFPPDVVSIAPVVAHANHPPNVGPGQIPIGIRRSIQAQSAMLRELGLDKPMAAGMVGPTQPT